MSDRSSPELDTLLARIAARTAALDGGLDALAPHAAEVRSLLADVTDVAVRLRESTAALGASLSNVLEAGETTSAERRHGRRDSPGTAVRRRVDPLTRLAILRGTDKWGPHHYTPVYHGLFQHLRELPIRLLEIGVGGHDSALLGGASLLMWADYFPHAHIVGIDVAEKRVAPHPRITILQGSQEDRGFLAQVLSDHGPFDIVIDDGSHVPAHVRASFDALFPPLHDDGFYVIEDVQTAFWPRFGGSRDGAETLELARRTLEAVNHAEISVVDPEWVPPPYAPALFSVRAYHNLLVFQKGDNRAPSTRSMDGGNVHIADALAVMEETLAGTPTAEGFAHLARTYSMARLGDRALDAARRGLSQWPDSVHLLMVGAKVGRRWADATLRTHCLERLAAVAGDDPSVGELIRRNSDA